jgi:peptide/nickel transport system permease protein
MTSGGRAFILDYWWLITMPGMAIFIVSLAFNLLGDGLREMLDPKGKHF